MKIITIAHTVDEKSGWGRYASNVINEVRKLGHEVIVVSAPELKPFSIINFFLNVLIIRKRIDKKVDAVHAFDCWPIGVYGAIALLGKKTNLFLTGVGTYSIPSQSRPLKAYLMRLAYAKAKDVFCISRYSLNRIKVKVPKSNLSIVHWGTTLLPILNEQESNELQASYSVSLSATPIVLTIGEIKHRKGQFDTLKAIKLAKQKYPNILYIALGSTAKKTYVSAMRKYAKENGLDSNLLVVDNCRDDKGLAFFYNLCDMFIMNSNNDGDHFEGFGLVFLEASQFGKPLVGSRDCGIEDAIQDGKTGYLTNQGDIEDIAKKIDLVLSNKVELGRAAQERAKSFTWSNTVRKYVDSYKKYAS